jgi:hypothetical protein
MTQAAGAMRRISGAQIIVFLFLLAIAGGAAAAGAALLAAQLDLGRYEPILIVAAAAFMLVLCAAAEYRLFQALLPLQTGEIEPGSLQEFIYHVHLLFFLLVFHPCLRSGVLPMPLLRVFYQILGCRMGPNTFTAGIICDPLFVCIGRDSLLGERSLLVPHVIENRRLAHYPIRIGSNVTIGAHAIVFSGTTIEDGALVGAGAVVSKGTHIRAGERWGGVPAKPLLKPPPTP